MARRRKTFLKTRIVFREDGSKRSGRRRGQLFAATAYTTLASTDRRVVRRMCCVPFLIGGTGESDNAANVNASYCGRGAEENFKLCNNVADYFGCRNTWSCNVLGPRAGSTLATDLIEDHSRP